MLLFNAVRVDWSASLVLSCVSMTHMARVGCGMLKRHCVLMIRVTLPIIANAKSKAI